MPETQEKSKPPKITWEAMVRPMAYHAEPWKTITVSARSPAQADAVLRRQGYETLTGSIQRTAHSLELLSPAKPRPVICRSCGYALDGLTIESTHVRCPECNFKQVLVAWSPEAEAETISRHSVGLYLLAGLGGIVLLCAMMFVLVFVFS